MNSLHAFIHVAEAPTSDGPAPQESGFLRPPAAMTGMPIIQRAAVECTRPHGMSAFR